MTTPQINPETVRIHSLTTIPADDQTMQALTELCTSTVPGRVHIINGAAIFLTDAELEFHNTQGVLNPEDFDSLPAWRDHLHNHMNEMLIEAGQLQAATE